MAMTNNEPMSKLQMDYGDELIEAMANEFGIPDCNVIRVLNGIRKINDFYRWVNADEYLMHKTNEMHRVVL